MCAAGQQCHSMNDYYMMTCCLNPPIYQSMSMNESPHQVPFVQLIGYYILPSESNGIISDESLKDMNDDE